LEKAIEDSRKRKSNMVASEKSGDATKGCGSHVTFQTFIRSILKNIRRAIMNEISGKKIQHPNIHNSGGWDKGRDFHRINIHER